METPTYLCKYCVGMRCFKYLQIVDIIEKEQFKEFLCTSKNGRRSCQLIDSCSAVECCQSPRTDLINLDVVASSTAILVCHYHLIL